MIKTTQQTISMRPERAQSAHDTKVKGSAIFEETIIAEMTVKPIIKGKGTILD
jgi:hypothetical protein